MLAPGVVRAALARGGSLPVTALASLIGSRMILSGAGEDAFAQYALLVSIPLLLPFLDFGIGTAVVNAVSRFELDPPAARRTTIRAFRVLCRVAAAGVALSLVLGLLSWWPAIFGIESGPGTFNINATACFILLWMSVPFGLGSRILLGTGRHDISVLVAASIPCLTAAILFAMLRAGVDNYLPIAFFVSFACATVGAFFFAQAFSPPELRGLLRGALGGDSGSAPNLRTTSIPMFLQIALGSIAIHADRVLLSHVATTSAVAEYFLSSQLYLPVLSVVSAAGLALWPVYQRHGERYSPIRMTLLFSAGAILLTTLTMLVAPTVLHFVSQGSVHVGTTTHLAWAAMITAYAAIYPIGMTMNDPRGLWIQVPFQAVSALANIGLTLALIPHLGAAGPLVASASSVLVLQVLPLGVISSRRHRAGEIVHMNSALPKRVP